MAVQVRLKAQGRPEMLETVELSLPAPGPGEILIRQEAAGVSFVDIYHRSGLYPVPGLPWVLGVEGAGVVEAVGESVGGLSAYAGASLGAYASRRLLPAARHPGSGDGVLGDGGGSAGARPHRADAAQAHLPGGAGRDPHGACGGGWARPIPHPHGEA